MIRQLRQQVEFQFTHPGGVRHIRLLKRVMGGKFQFTHPGGVRRLLEEGIPFDRVFQFTHPGGVRQEVTPFVSCGVLVSIHAPGRGATAIRGTLN